MSNFMKTIEQLMNVGLTPIAFIITFIIQLRVMRMISANRDLIMFYGKQIEELRKISAHQPQRPQASSEDTGLYEVLSE